MQKKLFIKSYGCQMNEYDSDKISDLLASKHYFITTKNPAEADLIILNTCSVRAKASEKIFSELGRLRFIKKWNPNLILAIGGCVSMEEKSNIFRRAPYVNIVFGPQTLHNFPEMYERACRKEKKIIDTSSPKIEKFDHFPSPGKTGPIAYVSIMEGCNKFCSYCIVPYTRGIEINRPADDILLEIKTLAAKGAKEIQLLGQNVNAYIEPNNKSYKLPKLIREVAKINEIERIRFMTSHPAEFDDELIEMFASEPKLADQLHLPVQSGSDRILKLMRRSYSVERYKEIINKVRIIRPNISISTDIIVGFPNETYEDFSQTMKLAKEINFDSSFSFIYSQRPNTPAAKMEDNVDLFQKKQRLFSLQNQLTMQAQQYNKNMIDTIQKVLVTNYSKKDPQQLSGRTENNRIVNFTSPENLIGSIIDVKITETRPNSLRGKAILI